VVGDFERDEFLVLDAEDHLEVVHLVLRDCLWLLTLGIAVDDDLVEPVRLSAQNRFLRTMEKHQGSEQRLAVQHRHKSLDAVGLQIFHDHWFLSVNLDRVPILRNWRHESHRSDG